VVNGISAGVRETELNFFSESGGHISSYEVDLELFRTLLSSAAVPLQVHWSQVAMRHEMQPVLVREMYMLPG